MRITELVECLQDHEIAGVIIFLLQPRRRKRLDGPKDTATPGADRGRIRQMGEMRDLSRINFAFGAYFYILLGI